MTEVGFEVGEELHRRQPGEIVGAYWGRIRLGHIVRDAKDRLHTVIAETEDGSWVRLQAVKDGTTASLRRPPADKPVDIYVPSEEECLILLREDLGARLLRDIEEREHSIARALSWRVKPVANSALAQRDHIDMIHNINVDDVLRKNKGTEVNPASKAQKKASLEELRGLHDQAHEDPVLWPMRFPHTHDPNVKE